VASDQTNLLQSLFQAIVDRDRATALKLIDDSPELAKAQLAVGATRQQAQPHYFPEIVHYAYAGDTALHLAAAAYHTEVVQHLLAAGADVHAKNRRGAQPLHYAADGNPDSTRWNPAAQAAIIDCLIAAGANPNALDNSGVAPLHRAVRTRCSAAVRALLKGGADPTLRNKNGSTPMLLATRPTGRGGSGSPAAHEQQEEIIRLLEQQPAAYGPQAG